MMGGGRGISSFELAWIALTVREGVGWVSALYMTGRNGRPTFVGL
jgi:hypothetical protein